jgi:hypothetical protein
LLQKYLFDSLGYIWYNISSETILNRKLNMKIYVNQINSKEIQLFGTDGLVGPDQNGNYFSQFVEYGTNAGGLDELVIADGCNRMVPIMMDSISDLIAALQTFNDSYLHMQATEMIKDKLESSDLAYVQDQEVIYPEGEKSLQGIMW